MISATGSSECRFRAPRAPNDSGFTLIEILLVIALIAIGSSVVITNFASFTDREGSLAPEEVLTAAIRQARFQAAAERLVTELRYSDESGHLVINPGNNKIPISENFGPEGSGSIRFFLIPPAQGTRPFPDPRQTTLETNSIAFAPDRSSSPFIVEIDPGFGGSPQRLRYDPFSSVILTEE